MADVFFENIFSPHNLDEEKKNKAFDLLMQKGILRVEITFSGGNDEGGADDICAYGPNDEQIPFPAATAYQSAQWNNETKSYENQKWIIYKGNGGYEDATEEEIAHAELRAILEEPMYMQYGSFAGDFYVNGKIIWDVAEGTVVMDYNEEVKNWQHNIQEF